MEHLLLRRTHVPGVDRLVAGAVVHAGDRVLVLRRSPDDHFLPGIEELPSGGRDPGETVAEALARELHEEIGWVGPVETDPGFATYFDYLTGSGKTARQYTFSVPVGERCIRLSSEHTGWRWLGRDEVQASDLTAETKRTVAHWWATLGGRGGAPRTQEDAHRDGGNSVGV